MSNHFDRSFKTNAALLFEILSVPAGALAGSYVGRSLTFTHYIYLKLCSIPVSQDGS